MKFINRCVVTLKPKNTLMDWVKGLEDAEVPEVWDFEGGAYPGSTHQISTIVHYNFREIIGCKVQHL